MACTDDSESSDTSRHDAERARSARVRVLEEEDDEAASAERALRI